MIQPDITVTIIFHREGDFAIPALASMKDLVDVARGAGLTVETQTILDRADESTRRVVGARAQWIDRVKEVSFGDLGLSRNAGTRLARGKFLSFLDGDDLWGAQWLRAAHAAATASVEPHDAVWHPEHLYIFSAADRDKMAQSAYQSFHSLMRSSGTAGFDPAMLIFHNLWSANAFASRELHIRFPYRAVDANRGLGIEDWSWNLETLAAGIAHHVVAGTVHLIRKRGTSSLDQQNRASGFLPHLPSSFVWGQN